ncbi:MAG TPA: hypothetical protein VF250_06685, partial [Conexibacter sp.]
ANLLCLVDGTGSGSCLPADVAAVRGTVSTDECATGAAPGEALVYGLVPDGVREVELTAPDGSATRADVGENLWKASVALTPSDRRPEAVGWVAPDGERVAYAIPYSPDANEPCR